MNKSLCYLPDITDHNASGYFSGKQFKEPGTNGAFWTDGAKVIITVTDIAGNTTEDTANEVVLNIKFDTQGPQGVHALDSSANGGKDLYFRIGDQNRDEYVVKDEQNMKGKWHELFGNDNPIHIEVGMGKGRFIMDMARLHPDINYVGIEKFSSVLVRVFEKGEVSYIYLNFSDPWPKDRHAKRRLTSVQFLERYEKILADGGGVTFKTDNRPLFDFTVEQADEAGWNKESVTYDLHNSEYVEGNVMTEYEERFSSMGNPIYRIVYSPK